MGGTVGLDVGSSGVRAVLLDGRLRVAARAELPLPPGRRTAHGGHRLDEAAVLDAARGVLEAVCRDPAGPPAAIAVCGTAGTLCLRDAAGRPPAAAVAYDDARHGGGIDRVLAWRRRVPRARRVVPAGDAVLEALGAEPGATDWTNALKLGWDPVSGRWPGAARHLRDAGFLPEAVPPGTPAGRAAGGPAAGALLVRGTTDGCALELTAGELEPERWTISLGTTVTWRSVVAGSPQAVEPPAGAYLHRLRTDVWLLSAAGNTGGGVLRALQPGADLAANDARSAVPTGLAAYPLARPGERFPVPDPRFAGFGLPAAGDPRLHAAVLEGVALVVRLGVDRLAAAGVGAPRHLRVTGGGATSALWMRLLAAATGRPVTAAPGADPALGMALLAAATHAGVAPGTLAATDAVPTAEHAVDPDLAAALAEPYAELCTQVTEWELAALRR
jgi:D-ribulokinase